MTFNTTILPKKIEAAYLSVNVEVYSESPQMLPILRERTGAVVSVTDFGPRGPLFETWPGRRLLWP